MYRDAVGKSKILFFGSDLTSVPLTRLTNMIVFEDKWEIVMLGLVANNVRSSFTCYDQGTVN